MPQFPHFGYWNEFISHLQSFNTAANCLLVLPINYKLLLQGNADIIPLSRNGRTKTATLYIVLQEKDRRV